MVKEENSQIRGCKRKYPRWPRSIAAFMDIFIVWKNFDKGVTKKKGASAEGNRAKKLTLRSS